MKLRQQAAKDLLEIITRPEYENSAVPITYAADCMSASGWSVSRDTLLDTARDLGFVVIGIRIYHPDA